MSEQDGVFGVPGKRREWLVRCTNRQHDLGVCSVEANDGCVEIISPHRDITTLKGAEIIEFRDALNAAIGRAEVDLSEREPSVSRQRRTEYS